MADKKDMEYAGFWLRVWAAFLDLLIFLLLAVPLLYAIHGREYARIAISARGPLDTLNMFVLPNVLVILSWFLRSATPGKMAASVRIVDADTGEKPLPRQFLIRLLGYYVAALPLGLGLLWIGIDKKKQGWHDKLAGTAVVRTRK